MEHSELFAEIKKIEIVTRNLVNDQLAGQYHSVFKGRGMAFDEVRQYQQGDDVRLIDWNVSARMNEPYIKVFVEEREMTVMLLVDVSASQSFGTVATKARLSAKLAAIFAFSAIQNNDRVGLIMFSDKIELFVPPKKGKKHVLRVVQEILKFRPEGKGTDISCGLDYLNKVTKRKAVGVLISDFQDERYEQSLRLANSRHDLVPICISDPVEEVLPGMGVVYMEDSETGEVFAVDTDSRQVREAFEYEMKKRRASREHLFRKNRIDFVNMSSGTDDMTPLVNFFRRRSKRAMRL
ncbi:MAG: DUF58 domain-containing protein [Deltaproteobacteria bacterium]|nr:DUF58 domain-containing protein [Deltaproteobacteria bacterium]MBN2670174.1 DUF58 domain-containing protein [Deltaproteobacteria bacterium]